jgi:hypothetical protein
MIYSEIAPAMQTIRTRRSPDGPRAGCNSDDVHDDRFMATGKLAEAAAAKASVPRKATFAAGPVRIAIRTAIKIATAAAIKVVIQDNDNCLFLKGTVQQP